MTTYSPQPHTQEDLLHQSLPARGPQELSGTGWPVLTWAWHSPQLLSVSPTAPGCSQQLPRASSKGSRARQSLPAPRAAGTRVTPWPRDVHHGQDTQLLVLLEFVLPAQPGWEQPVRASTEIFLGKGGFAAASWTFSFSPWFSGPLCCSRCRLSGALRSRSRSHRAAQPWGYSQMPVIYSSF